MSRILNTITEDEENQALGELFKELTFEFGDEEDEDEEEEDVEEPSSATLSKMEEIWADVAKRSEERGDVPTIDTEETEELEGESAKPTKPKIEPEYEPESVQPTMVALKASDISKDLTSTQSKRIDRLMKLLSGKGINLDDFPNYDPKEIDWSNWSQDEIKAYNDLIHHIKYDSYNWSDIKRVKAVDPYAMSQIRIDLWPEIKYGDTTIRQAIKDLLHPQYKEGIAPDDSRYKIEQQDGEYLAIPIQGGDEALPIKVSGNEYHIEIGGEEVPLKVITRHGENAWSDYVDKSEGYEDLINLFSRTFQYYKTNKTKSAQLNFMDWLNQYLEHNAVTYIPKAKMGGVMGLFKHKESDTYTIQPLDASREELIPVLADPATVKARLSFGPKSQRRPIMKGYDKESMVGGLSGAISNLFDSLNFNPRNPDPRIDWETVYKLIDPMEKFLEIANRNRERKKFYMLDWDDYDLLTLYRMFTSVLPPPQGPKPASPNRTEWDKNFKTAERYPQKLGAPVVDINRAVRFGLMPDLNVYVYDGPRLSKQGETIITPDDKDYKYYDKLGNLSMALKSKGMTKKLDQIMDIIKKSVSKIPTEGIITSPATVIVNGSPFKLRFGDRIIIDDVKEFTSNQK